MESLQSRKRRNADNTLQDNRPAKRIKHTAVRSASNFPPKFWDNLSKTWLTPRALRELDRRNNAQLLATTSATSVEIIGTSLARFARRGGPDLRHLRGYPKPNHVARMNSSRSLGSSSRRTQSTKATSVSSKSKRSSAYDKNFEQNLVDNRIYPKGYEYPDGDSIPEPRNLDDIVKALSAPRASLSPSRFTRSAFKTFALANDRVISEGKVVSDILPTIRGNNDIPSEGTLPFTSLDSITDGTTVDAVPDLYDGSYPKTVHKIVRQDLSNMITPTSHGRPTSLLKPKLRGEVPMCRSTKCRSRPGTTRRTAGSPNPSTETESSGLSASCRVETYIQKRKVLGTQRVKKSRLS